MSASGKHLSFVFSVLVTLLLITQCGCDIFEEPGGSMAVPFTRVERTAASPKSSQSGSASQAPSNRARRQLPAPISRASVPGGELPAMANLPGEFSLGEGVTYGAVRIFPIYCTTQTDSEQEYISLPEAQETGAAEITERSGGATVGTVQIRNNSERAIYVVAGDIITGGNQDRVIAGDMIVPPNSSQPVSAQVYCVERGRWTPGESGAQFECRRQACVNLKKSLVSCSVGQGAVWAKVSEINARLGTVSSTGTYRVALEDESVSSKVEAYVSAFDRKFKKDDKAVGFAVCVGKKVVACDIFLNSSLLSAMREKLINSYVMGIMSMDDVPARVNAKSEDVACFLKGASAGQAALQRQDGSCKLYRVEHGEIEGFFTEVGGVKTHLFLSGKQ